MTKLKKRWAIAVAGLLLFLLAGYFALTRVADHYLQDGGLARAIGKKTAFILKADAGYLPLFWRGLTVRSDGLLVRFDSSSGVRPSQAERTARPLQVDRHAARSGRSATRGEKIVSGRGRFCHRRQTDRGHFSARRDRGCSRLNSGRAGKSLYRSAERLLLDFSEAEWAAPIRGKT